MITHQRWREMGLLVKKVAVITDAISPAFFFPRWQRYYGGLFGPENLHVITYAGMKPLFHDVQVGNIWEVNSPYDDKLRVDLIADFTAVLLNSYDVVLRCDVDEFLFPDPAKFLNLADFVEQNKHPYVTARGVDVIELEDDLPLDSGARVLGNQRHYGLRSAALNKTCLTTVPLRWAAGFHGANVPPHFSCLYNFHLKWADIKARIAWNEKMLMGLTPGTSEHTYFAVGAEHLLSVAQFFSNKAKLGEEAENEFDQRFLDSVSIHQESQIYQGEFITQDFLFSLEKQFNTPAADF